jgi:hypothetical protein
MALASQVVHNMGVYHVCHRLWRLGWDVDLRKGEGIDISACKRNSSCKITVQVKSLSKPNPAPLGKDLANLAADFVVVCRLDEDSPKCYILTTEEVKQLADRWGQNEPEIYTLERRNYEHDKFLDWSKLNRNS